MNAAHYIYLSLGSNSGDRFLHLQNAIDALFETIGSIEKISPVYETPSWGFEGDPFLNVAIIVRTSLSAKKVLKKILRIETQLGRIRNKEKGYQDRTIDIDLLFFHDQIIQEKDLAVPHPHLHKRRFVLQPLSDIAPEFLHPETKKNIPQLLAECEDNTSIHKMQRWLKNPIAAIDLSKYNFIAIEGNIGAGKTSLASKIAEDFNAKLVLERFADNPFLPKFYKDKNRYAFPLEMSFLADRYQQSQDDLNQLDLFKDFIIADYDIYKSLIFAKITLQEEEFNLYRKLFDIMYKETKKPELYLFLHQNTDKLLQNIQKRGRNYEKTIQPDYLEAVQKGYLDFIKTLPKNQVKMIDISNLNFVEKREDYLKIVRQIAQD